MLYAERIPSSGGDTSFADMYAAYDALDPNERGTLAQLRAIHNLNFSRNRRHGEEPMTEAQRAAVPPVAHPVIRTHPETGRKCVFLGDHAETIQGMDYDEGRRFIESLNERIVRLREDKFDLDVRSRGGGDDCAGDRPDVGLVRVTKGGDVNGVGEGPREGPTIRSVERHLHKRILRHY